MRGRVRGRASEGERLSGSRDDDDEDGLKWVKGGERASRKPTLTLAIKMALGPVGQKTSKNARKLRY